MLYENIGVGIKSDVIDHPSLKGTMSYSYQLMCTMTMKHRTFI